MSLQDGYYKCRATGNASFGVSDTGTESMAVELAILDETEATTLALMTSYLYFTEKTAELSAKRLRAIGLVGVNVSIDPLPGLGSVVAQCEVKTEEYNGKYSQKVEIKTGGPAFKNPMTADHRRRFAGIMKDYLAPLPAVGSVATNGAARPAAAAPAAPAPQRQAAPAPAPQQTQRGGFAPRAQQSMGDPPPDPSFEPGATLGGDDDIPF